LIRESRITEHALGEGVNREEAKERRWEPFDFGLERQSADLPRLRPALTMTGLL
jgi:hypothetical protein